MSIMGVTLAESLADRLGKVVRRRGIEAISADLGIGNSSIKRAIAGQPVRMATAALVAKCIDDLEAPKANGAKR